MAKRHSPRITAGERIADAAVRDARASVARESDNGILGPGYTIEALQQMGWQRSKGASARYRHAFTDAFVTTWWARFVFLNNERSR